MSEDKEIDDSIMRAHEVWQMLKIGKNTLYSWCDQKIIPHKKVGRVLLFSRKSLQEWIDNKEAEGGN